MRDWTGLMSRSAMRLMWVWLVGLASVMAEEGWVSLFDGETLAGWTNGKGEAMAEGKWVAEGGLLHRKSLGAGSLFTEKEYGDFAMEFEWKISKGGNSGVKYRLQQIEGKWLGLEYQVLDDENFKGGEVKAEHEAAGLYDLKAPEGRDLKAVGEWNQARIEVKEGVVRHFLNGALVMELAIPGEEWEERFEKSKYRKAKGFGVNARGKIHLQDHGNQVWFRYLRIQEY
ncbi:MAG: DUF1080 domain-containing protein [Verrucomicrobiota bacterium]